LWKKRVLFRATITRPSVVPFRVQHDEDREPDFKIWIVNENDLILPIALLALKEPALVRVCTRDIVEPRAILFAQDEPSSP
jgi:hypothetical protein